VNIAIIGSGVSGLVAAYKLAKKNKVTIFEARDRAGGHANTVSVEDKDTGLLNIDTGFIVHNDRNYPNLLQIFEELKIQTQPSEMSFSVSDPNRNIFYRATNLKTLFAHKPNLVKKDMWQMLYQISKFNKLAKNTLENNSPQVEGSSDFDSRTAKDFLHDYKFSKQFIDLYFIPLGASIWSADPNTFLEFPAISLFRFLDNHGLLGLGNRPNWRTITNGSKVYVDAIIKYIESLGAEVLLDSPVKSVSREENSSLRLSTEKSETQFDAVIFACHADQALNIISDPTEDETQILSSFKFIKNTATLHTDMAFMPQKKNNWASWNYLVPEYKHVSSKPRLTYDLTNLQRLDTDKRYLVTLNCSKDISEAKKIIEFEYKHPIFDTSAISAQYKFDQVNGSSQDARTNTYFCGAYWGYGFHEDGATSAINVVEKIEKN